MKTLTNISCEKNRKWLPPVAWLLAIVISLLWNVKAFDREQEKNSLQSARSFFQLIVAATNWDIDDEVKHDAKASSSHTSPHIAHIDAHENIELTHTDPALITQLISNITVKENGVLFRITSLKHSSISNKADEWEQKALQSFEEGSSESGAYVNGGVKRRYHYMAPLFTTEKCIKCHGKQGYELGDIRGGISVILPPEKRHINWPLFVSHGLAALIGIILFRFFTCQLWKAEEKMELLASRDSLTGVANRRFFQQYLGREWLRAKRNGSSLSFLMCDIDFFKLYNDTYGHQAGDNCLSQVAEALASGLKRPGDFIARYGDEKFTIILPETSLHGAESLAEKILKCVENLRIEHLSSSASKYVTVSIGVTNNETLSSQKEIIIHANKALTRAKKEGKNRVVCLSHDTESSTEETPTNQ